MATVSKGAVFALLLRFFASVDLLAHPALVLVFTVLAAASMIGGTLLAVLQGSVKSWPKLGRSFKRVRDLHWTRTSRTRT